MTAQPVDHAARQQAITATGSVLVQAPAGSGKTTLLTQRYLRLLATVEAPEQILALTFTRRAAQEMRERVLQALRAATSARCPAGMNPQTWSLGVAARDHMLSQGLDLERHPSRLRIETIDAFNAWLAGQLPITAGAGSRLNLADAPQPLYAEAARRALAYDAADQFGTAVDRVLALDDQRWHGLVTLISGMLPSRDRWLPLLAGRLRAASALDDAQLREVRRHLDEDLALLVARTLGVARDAIGRERLPILSRLMHGAAARLEDPAARAEWRNDDSVLQPGVADFARWRAVARLLLTGDGAYRKRLTKTEGFPAQCADKAVMMEVGSEPRDLYDTVSKRFLARIDEPTKNWKFSMADMAERKRWDDYQDAYEDCLHATSSDGAPWYVVPADDKENARLIISQVLLDELGSLKMCYPQVSEQRVKELKTIRKLLVK